MTTKELRRQCLQDSAAVLEEIYEAALMEEVDAVKRLFDDAFRIVCTDIFNWLKEEYNINILNQDKIDELINLIYWNEDGKEITDRLDKYYQIYAATKDTAAFLTSLEILFHTEVTNTIAKIPKNVFEELGIDTNYEIFVVEGCDDCQAGARDGEFPPYHKNCKCCGEWITVDDMEDEYDIEVEDIF